MYNMGKLETAEPWKFHKVRYKQWADKLFFIKKQENDAFQADLPPPPKEAKDREILNLTIINIVIGISI